MKRSAPLSRGTGFASKRPAHQVKTTTYTARPREAACVVQGVVARAVVAVPKFAYVRDERLREMCRAMPCQRCGACGPYAGVTWAHSNQGKHGKGKGIKASDLMVAAMCHTCHAALDQGSLWTEAERVAIWNAAHARTVRFALANGLWPAGLPVPTINEGATA